jgi:hypothetical protein
MFINQINHESETDKVGKQVHQTMHGISATSFANERSIFRLRIENIHMQALVSINGKNRLSM